MSGLLLMAILALGGASPAATPGPHATIITDAQVEAALSVLRSNPREVVHPVAPPGGFHYVAIVRRARGEAEVHERWTDITTIRSGSGTLRTGRQVPGRRETTAGEFRGATIADGRDVEVHPGDVLVIPAGLAHQLAPDGGEPLVYFTIKVPR